MSLSFAARSALALQSISGLGLQTLDTLFQHFGSFSAIEQASLMDLQHAGLKPELGRVIAEGHYRAEAALQRERERLEVWLMQPDCHALTMEDAAYPALLKQIHSPPALLYVQGNLAALNYQALAMVGSRKPSVDGLRSARAFASAFAEAGLVIHSGLAVGIDGAAHQGVLDVGGMTGAVMATGMDQIYPRSHRKLAEQICEQGALITEMPLGTAPTPNNFPRRNRLISGLSRGVLVVEAGIQSGSLITARYALEQNRDVFAMPGSIHNPQTRGPHALIKSGARLVETIDDVLHEWAYPVAEKPASSVSSPRAVPERFDCSPEERKVLELMGFDVTSFDQLVLGSRLEYGELSGLLVSLELQGALRQVPGGYQRLYQADGTK